MGEHIGKPRNQSIEVFRCLLMLAIVIGHSYVHGIYGLECGWPLQDKAWWPFLFTTMLVWHVDGFVAISGWFGIKFSWRKFLSLWGVMLFYGVVGGIGVLLFAHNAPPIRRLLMVSCGWFGGSYMLLMFMAPIFNAALDALTLKGKRMLLSTWAIMAIGFFMATELISKITGVRPVGFGSHTVLTMILVYITAGVARRVLDKPVSLKLLLCVCGIFPLGMVISVVQNLLCGMITGTYHLWPSLVYSDPAVYIFAIALMLMFLWHIKVPHWLGKVCQFLGPSMFGVYLLHDATRIGPWIYRIPERFLVDHTTIHVAVITFGCAVFTFVVCIGVDLLRRLMVHYCKPVILPVLNRVDPLWDRLLSAAEKRLATLV